MNLTPLPVQLPLYRYVIRVFIFKGGTRENVPHTYTGGPILFLLFGAVLGSPLNDLNVNALNN